MTELPEPVLSGRFQSRVRTWLFVFSAVSLTTALAAPPWGERPYFIAMCLPFFHCFLLWAVLFIRSLPDPWMSPSSLYIKQNYPEIWKRLRPWGDLSHNTFAAFAFLAGRYDAGGDPHLELIKERSRRLTILFVWPLALIPVCWAIATPIYFALGLKATR